MTAADLGRAPGPRNARISNMMDQCTLTLRAFKLDALHGGVGGGGRGA